MNRRNLNDQYLELAYLEMAQDKNREQKAKEWSELLLKDLNNIEG